SPLAIGMAGFGAAITTAPGSRTWHGGGGRGPGPTGPEGGGTWSGLMPGGPATDGTAPAGDAGWGSAPGVGKGSASWLGWPCCPGARDRLHEQPELVGVVALAARAVQAAQRPIEPVPQRLVVAPPLLEGGEQLQGQPLQRAHVVGQVLGGGRRQASGSGVRE